MNSRSYGNISKQILNAHRIGPAYADYARNRNPMIDLDGNDILDGNEISLYKDLLDEVRAMRTGDVLKWKCPDLESARRKVWAFTQAIGYTATTVVYGDLLTIIRLA